MVLEWAEKRAGGDGQCWSCLKRLGGGREERWQWLEVGVVSKVFLPEEGDLNALGAGGKGVVEDAVEIEGGCQGGGRDGLGPG